MNEWRFDISGNPTPVTCPGCRAVLGLPFGLKSLSCPICGKVYTIGWHEKKRSVYLQSDVPPIDEFVPGGGR